MDKEALARLGIQYDEGVARFAGQPALYEKYLLRMPQDLTFSLLRQAVAEKNGREAFFQAHTLKGILGNLSLTALYQELSPLVERLRHLEDPTALAGELSVFGVHFEQTMAALRGQQP